MLSMHSLAKLCPNQNQSKMRLFYTVSMSAVLRTRTRKFLLKSENNWKIIHQINHFKAALVFCFTDETCEAAIVMEDFFQ